MKLPISFLQVTNKMAGDVENQLIADLKANKYTIQLDEATTRGNEAIRFAYVRFFSQYGLKKCCLQKA